MSGSLLADLCTVSVQMRVCRPGAADRRSTCLPDGSDIGDWGIGGLGSDNLGLSEPRD